MFPFDSVEAPIRNPPQICAGLSSHMSSHPNTQKHFLSPARDVTFLATMEEECTADGKVPHKLAQQLAREKAAEEARLQREKFEQQKKDLEAKMQAALEQQMKNRLEKKEKVKERTITDKVCGGDGTIFCSCSTSWFLRSGPAVRCWRTPSRRRATRRLTPKPRRLW